MRFRNKRYIGLLVALVFVLSLSQVVAAVVELTKKPPRKSKWVLSFPCLVPLLP
jgi:hypothetical protein